MKKMFFLPLAFLCACNTMEDNKDEIQKIVDQGALEIVDDAMKELPFKKTPPKQ